MATLYPTVYFDDTLIPSADATLSIASSAVLYGLSVYTVFHVANVDGDYYGFRLRDHYKRLKDSCKIIGIDTFSQEELTYDAFLGAMKQLVHANTPSDNSFVRASFHVNELLPGTRSRGLTTILSAFMYDATPIVPTDGVRLKTSVWRRTPDYAIPSRAKVNGAYINSVLARQDAIDSGYDDCIFLDSQGHVAELSAANIFVVRDGTLLTPGRDADILEGINRRTIIELAQKNDIQVVERPIDLTELYVADEVFVCGTSAFLSPVIEIDSRQVGQGDVTKRLQAAYRTSLLDPTSSYLTKL
jgi:branched-chain amino acid aminotransferase